MVYKSDEEEEVIFESVKTKSDRWKENENLYYFESPGSFDRFINRRISSDGGFKQEIEESRESMITVKKFPSDLEDQIQHLSELNNKGTSYIVGTAILHGIEYADYMSDIVHVKDRLKILNIIKDLVRVSDVCDRNLYNGDIYQHINTKTRTFRLTETESDKLELACREYDSSKTDFIMWSIMSMLKKSELIYVKYQAAHRQVDENWDKSVQEWFKGKKASLNRTILYSMREVIQLYQEMYANLRYGEKIDLESIERLHKLIRTCRKLRIIKYTVRDYREILLGKQSNEQKKNSGSQKRKTNNGNDFTSKPDFYKEEEMSEPVYENYEQES